MTSNFFSQLEQKFNLKKVSKFGDTYLIFSSNFPFLLVSSTQNPYVISLFTWDVQGLSYAKTQSTCQIFNSKQIHDSISHSINEINKYILLKKKERTNERLKKIDEDFL